MADFTCSGANFSASKKPWNMLRVQNLTRKLSNLLIFHHVSTLSFFKNHPWSRTFVASLLAFQKRIQWIHTSYWGN